MEKSNEKLTTFASIVSQVMEFHQLSMVDMASKCSITPQTVKNILDGKSVSSKFLVNFIEVFKIDDDAKLLRDTLVSFSILQINSEKREYWFKKAKLLDK
jgi:hypothetical protein